MTTGVVVAGEQPHCLVQSVGDLAGRCHPHPGRSQLDCKRKAIDPLAEAQHVSCVGGIEREARRRDCSPITEETNGIAAEVRRRTGLGDERRRVEWSDRPHRLVVAAETATAGGEHARGSGTP